MSVQLSGRRRAVGNRDPNPGNSLGTINSNNKGCNHGCDCSADKYRLNKGMDLATLVKRSIPFAIFFCGITTMIRPRSSSLSPYLPLQAAKHKDTVGNCELRKYSKRRHYGLHDRPLPVFLEAEYIYGELPRLLYPNEVQQERIETAKLCVDQSEWYDPEKVKDPKTSIPALPFADGTNPSILKLFDNPRIDPSIREVFGNIIGPNKERPYYLATICMTNSQCSWKDSPEDITDFHLSKDENPSTERTVFLVLNRNFETMKEATIYTKIDAQFGRVKPKNQTRTFKLDDARFFTHKGQIWVSYREGKLFGYDKQVLNKLHFDFVGSETTGVRTEKDNTNKKLTVTLLASDTETLCCGRNMALIDNVHTDQLQALTWVDPVTVVDVDVSKTDEATSGADKQQQQTQRRLKQNEDKKKKSHFHGTNGFMVHLPETGEYLGIGHFHRPQDRDKNEYARFGHHYTHAFFTISDQPPFRLKRLSPELVLSSQSYPDDAEIIQFWSGLELTTGKDGKEGALLALAYGINDCEGAARHLDRSFVEGLLRNVPVGNEVVDLMMPLK